MTLFYSHIFSLFFLPTFTTLCACVRVFHHQSRHADILQLFPLTMTFQRNEHENESKIFVPVKPKLKKKQQRDTLIVSE